MKTKTRLAGDRGIKLAKNEMSALAALKINPWHTPVDGLCLEQLHRNGLIRPVRDGFIPTPLGERILSMRDEHSYRTIPTYPEASGPVHPVFNRN